MNTYIDTIFAIFASQNPHPTTELQFENAFELLIAVLLSAQATDISVNKCTAKLFAVANTPCAMLALGEAKIKSYIKSIGLYQTKAKHIMQTCEILVTKYNSIIPQTREELQTLPGVGRKTANVVLNTMFNQPTLAVDTHILRVSNRLGFVKSKNVLHVELALLKIIPEKYLLNAHHWLILHGRYICKARKPECAKCVVAQYCPSVEPNGNA